MGFEGKWPALVRHKRSKSYPENRASKENNSVQTTEENNSVLTTEENNSVLTTEENNLVESTEAANVRKLDTEPTNGCTDSKKKASSSNTEAQLRQEILMLEKRLQDHVSVRCALENALGYRNSSQIITDASVIPKPTSELIKDISVLEVEVGHLEQYLLSLYRKAFDQHFTSLSPPKKHQGFKTALSSTPRRRRLDFLKSEIASTKPEAEYQALPNVNGPSEEKVLDSSNVQRSHSSLSQRSALVNTTAPSTEALGKALRSCHSQPLSMMEYAQNSSSHVTSLAEHLGTRISDHVPETPNKLSEDMVKCMCNIYCKLADPQSTNHGLSSPASTASSISLYSPKDQRDMWSPGFEARLDNPFHVEGLKDFSGPYSSMIEVNFIYRDSHKLGDIEHLLQNFRSLISQLEEIDPKKMTNEEKMAFWINVHNSLVMHAFLAYGVPQNNIKRMFLLLKAAYNVGGQIVSADVIQSSILGCRLSRPGQWLRLLLSSKTKFKAGDERQAYSIERPEPLLYFALSAGSHSDPAVRVFTPKRVFQELEAAKEDYIRATFGVRKDHKVVLPKIVESFAKDSGLCQAGVLEMIQQCLPDKLRKSIKKCQKGKGRKIIEWAPHNFGFRYLILKEMK